MKKTIVFLVNFLLIHTAQASKMSLIDIIEPLSSSEAYLLLSSNGQVYELDQRNEKLVDLAKAALSQKRIIEVELAKPAAIKNTLGIINEVLEISLTQEVLPKHSSNIHKNVPQVYNTKALIQNSYISDFSSYNQLKEIFAEMRTDTDSGSECYNRAHMWSYELNKEMHNGRKIQTGKIWLFFTRQYIRKHRYKWWFHIAPYLTLNKEVIVIDRKFTTVPVEEKVWTDVFIESKQKCPVVYDYTDYSENQYTSDCYVIKSSVFYWQPYQLENVEKTGKARTKWITYEVNKAYDDAIDDGNIWDWDYDY